MPLESATYISQLNAANPASTDLLGQGDDHIRLLKSTIKATFPNITGPVTATQAQIAAAVAMAAGGGSVPVGAIMVWYGQSTNVPATWAICNGQTVPKTDGSGNITTPDLRDRVVIGAGTIAPENTNHGSANQTATSSSGGSHSHSTLADGGHTHPGATVAGHALVISEMPSHSHTVDVYANSGSGSLIEDATSIGGGAFTTTGSEGGGAAHSHGLNWPGGTDGAHSHATDTSGAHTHGVTVAVYQPAHALHYIMKV